jgi:hypothetical protein
MQLIPLQEVPNQSLQVTLMGQSCTLNVYTQFWGMFMDVLVSGSPIIQGVLCLNQVWIVRSFYLGFVGDFAWLDNQPSLILGPSPPYYAGLGSRFSLVYFAPADILLIDPEYGQST